VDWGSTGAISGPPRKTESCEFRRLTADGEELLRELKVELVHDAAWATRAAARTELFEYLERFYNGQRRHSALGYLSPRAFEERRTHEALAT
jgi:transposase InsO family protein